MMICIPSRDTSPHQDSAGTAPSDTPPPAQPPPPPRTRGTRSHSAPVPLKRPMFTPEIGPRRGVGGWGLWARASSEFGLHKIFVYFEAFLHESNISQPTLLQYYCTTFAQYTTPPDSPFVCHAPYNIRVNPIDSVWLVSFWRDSMCSHRWVETLTRVLEFDRYWERCCVWSWKIGALTSLPYSPSELLLYITPPHPARSWYRYTNYFHIKIKKGGSKNRTIITFWITTWLPPHLGLLVPSTVTRVAFACRYKTGASGTRLLSPP